jgi:hypothetical protein
MSVVNGSVTGTCWRFAGRVNFILRNVRGGVEGGIGWEFTSGSSRQVHWPSQTGHISVSLSSSSNAL